jgi:hypothetical protein
MILLCTPQTHRNAGNQYLLEPTTTTTYPTTTRRIRIPPSILIYFKHRSEKLMTEYDGSLSTEFRQAEKCGGINPLN